jgi:hypothetical protein
MDDRMSGYWLASPFRNELDILECQLREVGHRVKGVVICEATTTQTGHPKPLHYPENKNRFAQWEHLIHYVSVDLPGSPQPPGLPQGSPGYEENWVRERYQRDMLAPLLFELADSDDIVINADMDEVPAPDAFAAHVPEDTPVGLFEQLRGFAVDYFGTPGVTSTLVRMSHLRASPSLSRIREMRETLPRVERGGWHLSWIGGRDAIREKMHVTPHQETYERGMAENEAGRMYGGGTPVNVPYVTTFEERDALPWEDQVPLWVHQRGCPDIWWHPETEG